MDSWTLVGGAVANRGGGDPVPADVVIVDGRVRDVLGAETLVRLKPGKDAVTKAVGVSTYRDLHYARVWGDAQFSPCPGCSVSPALPGVSWFDAESGQRINDA